MTYEILDIKTAQPVLRTGNVAELAHVMQLDPCDILWAIDEEGIVSTDTHVAREIC